MEKPFQDTTATQKIFNLTKRIRAVSGGTWASKTVSILVWIIDYCQSADYQVVTVVAESFPHLNLGAIRDFKNILVSNGYWLEENWNEGQHVYKFPKTESIVEFVSFDKFGKAHGPRRDVLFINEANNIPWTIADQLITRTRKIVWLDWNPSEEFWFYTEMLPVRKDLVRHGIQLVQQQKIFVTNHSLNIKKEYRNYLWDVDKNGKILKVPASGFDHHMDGIRYGFESFLEIASTLSLQRQEEHFMRTQIRQNLNSAK